MDAKNFVSDLLSYKVDAADYKTDSSWDGILSFYDYKADTFPAGFVRFVSKKLERKGYRVRVVSREAPAPTGPESPVVDDYPTDSRYDYQEETMRRLVACKGMIAQCATGAGKSRIFKLCERRLGLPTLFITTRKSLMYQMAEDYQKNIGGKVGILGDGKWNPSVNGVNFAIVDTLSSRLTLPSLSQEVNRLVEKNVTEIEKAIAKEETRQKIPSAKVMRKLPPELDEKRKKIRSAIEKRMTRTRASIEAEVKTNLAAKQKRYEQTKSLLRNIGFLCLEEAHEVGSDSFFKIAQACRNAHYRLALTATPFMRDDEGANKRLMAATGPISIKVSEKLLIDRGILATPYFKYINLSRPKGLSRSTAWQSAYRIGIAENEERNQKIVEEVSRATSYGLTSMVLISRQTHGERLKDALEASGVRVRFIFGKHEQTERKAALEALRAGEIDCLIGSTILDVGVDVPSVGLVVLAGAGKAEVAIRQRIGRGLRAKKSGANVCFIVDFNDSHNNNLNNHSKERRRIVEETPGFAEGIVDDFDYEGLGFTKEKVA